MSTLLRLILEGTIMLVAYLGMLLLASGQRAFYMDLFRALKGSSSVGDKESLKAVLMSE
jgi:hypothetical protein